MGAVEETLGHGVSGLGGAFILLVAQGVKERFFGAPKPIEDSVSAITGGFDRLTDRLDLEIDRQAEQIAALRADNHKLRNELQKLKAYAELVFRHVATLEDKLTAAGLDLPARPTLPSLN